MLTTQAHVQIVQIKKILHEDEKRFDHLLKLLKKWMDCHAFIPKDYDKRMLPIFLRNCKYNLDQAKQKLELYFVHKKRYPEMFCFNEFNDSERKGLDNYYIFESSKLTPEGYKVSISGYRSPDTTGCEMNAVNKLLAMYGTYKANLDVVNCGMIMVFNFQHLSPSIVSAVFNKFFIRIMEMLQRFAPFRVGGIYIIFMPGFVVPIVNMAKMILKEKLRNRLHIEAGNEQMKKNVPMYCLPKEFGGTDGTINDNAAKFIQEIMQAKPWFLEHEKIQIMGDIPKHLCEATGIDENYGTQGSFRKLNID